MYLLIYKSLAIKTGINRSINITIVIIVPGLKPQSYKLYFIIKL